MTQTIPLSHLKGNNGQIEGLPKNPRVIRNDRFKKLVNSIQDTPEMLSLRELLVFPHGKEYVIIGGNMRYRAMQELGYTEAACKVIDESTPVETLRAIVIKDNVPFGENDSDAFANEWDLDELLDFGIEPFELGGVEIGGTDEEPQTTPQDTCKIEIYCESENEREKLLSEFIQRGIDARMSKR